MDKDTGKDHWWSPLVVETGATAVLCLGPLTVRIHRGSDEWLVASERDDDAAEPVRASLELSRNNDFGSSDSQRYVTRDGTGKVTVLPLLADRPIVVRPRQPISILPGEETTLYLSSPVWVRIVVGEPPRTLQEIPVSCMSDTWFGPSTLEGELCYATKSHARHSLAEMPPRPHRAMTPVNVRNQANDPLPIDKLSLPVPLLSVYGDRDGRLWTEGVKLTRTADSNLADFGIDPGAPRDAADAALLTAPREAPDKGRLVRAFSGLFG